ASADRDRDHGRSADLTIEVKDFYVYMMTNRSRSVLYTGVTNSLERRTWFHRNSENKSFTKTYRVDRLVYYEHFNEARYAIAREKEIKDWRREKKNDLVRMMNPKWEDLVAKVPQPRIVRSLAVCAARDDMQSAL